MYLRTIICDVRYVRSSGCGDSAETQGIFMYLVKSQQYVSSGVHD